MWQLVTALHNEVDGLNFASSDKIKTTASLVVLVYLMLDLQNIGLVTSIVCIEFVVILT